MLTWTGYAEKVWEFAGLCAVVKYLKRAIELGMGKEISMGWQQQ
jgi:hypothetical protein